MDLLIIAPNDFESIEKKSVLYQYENYREGGYFDNIISLFPFTKIDLTRKIDENKFFYQYGWKSKFHFLNNYKVMKFIGTIIVLFKILFVFPFVIKKHNIKIIRATDPYLNGLIGLYYSKLFKVPLAISVHSDYDKGDELGGKTFKLFGSRKTADKLAQFVYKNCDAILPIRDYLKQKIKKKFLFDESKIKIFPHGIDFVEYDNTTFINVYDYFSIDKELKIISFIARLSKENYIYDLIDIVEQLSVIRDDFIVLVLGDGEEYHDLIKLAERKKISKFIRFFGFQNKDIVVNTRKQSYVSLSLMGGFSLIEACAGNRPVISYDVEWHNELVKDDITGYLIKEHDTKVVVAKINNLFNNEILADKLGNAARDLVLENNNIANIIKIKQNIYTKIIEEYKC